MQIKDMALKFSGAYRQCKPCTGPSSSSSAGGGGGGYRRGERPTAYVDFDQSSDVPNQYLQSGSCSSTPAWDFPAYSRDHPSAAMSSDSRFRPVSGSGNRTPRGLDSTSNHSDAVVVEEDEAKEWMAQVEPGVHITFVSLPQGVNDLKRIRFRY